MPSKGQSVTLIYMAYNTSTGAYTTGDVANHTLRLIKDGTEAAPTNSPAEVDATNAPGAYSLVLTTAESTFNIVWLGGKSSASNVIIQPVQVGFENLPTPAPGAANGVLIAGSNAATTYATITSTGAFTINGTALNASNLDAAVSSRSTFAGTTVLAESYSTAGGTRTLAQGINEICSLLEYCSTSGTTLSSFKEDGTTVAMTFTLNDATNPSSRLRAT